MYEGLVTDRVFSVYRGFLFTFLDKVNHANCYCTSNQYLKVPLSSYTGRVLLHLKTIDNVVYFQDVYQQSTHYFTLPAMLIGQNAIYNEHKINVIQWSTSSNPELNEF